MKSKYISRTKGNRRLILIFAGWAMDWRPFRELSVNGYDILVIWDYRELTFNWKPLLRYEEICLLAWSMGVFAASVTIHELLPRLTKRIAVNGTLSPIDDGKGIPEAIFHGTVEGLTPNSLRKFYRRMCVTSDEFRAFSARKPQRDFEEMLDELRAIETHTVFHVPQVEEWDLAVIGRNDAIFPAANQVNAWKNVAAIRLMQAGHLPDFGLLLSRLFIDKELVSSRFTNSHGTYSDNAVVQHRIAARLYEMLLSVLDGRGPVGNVIEVGVGDGTLTRLYAPGHSGGTVRLWDIAGIDEEVCALTPAARPERCDAEIRMRRQQSESASFILSTSTIQWFNSPASFLRECSRVLVPGGWLVLSTFVQGNLPELNSTVGTGLQLPTAEAWQSMLPAEMEVAVRHEGYETVYMDSPRAVLEHLRDTGVNAVSYGRNPTVLARHILSRYPVDADGRCPMTFRPLFLIARKSEG